MKIVVLDALPLNPGDLDWSALESLGELTIHPATRPEQTAARVADAEAVFTNKVRLGADQFAAAGRLKLVSVLATGYDVIDLAAARRRGVVVCNVPGYSTNSVAQLTFALLLELTHRAGEHSAAVHAGEWCRSETFSFWRGPLVELAGKTMAVIGVGHIGRRVARIAEAMGMAVLAVDRPQVELPAFCRRVSLEEAFAQADVVSLHCPLTEQTRGLVDAARLATMKEGAFLLNAARGPLVEEAAVAAALREGRLGGYGADVLGTEPPAPDNPLLGAPRCVLTPHLAWASQEARRRLLEASAENLRAFLAGTPQNVVS